MANGECRMPNAESRMPNAECYRTSLATRSAARHADREFYNLTLRPVAIVARAGGVRERPAVAAVSRYDESDVRIGGNDGIAERLGRDEGVVLGGDDERRRLDAVDHAQGRRAMVIVLGAGEAEVRRRVGGVELPDRPDRAQA